jgi:hypothetical protein
MCQKTVPVRKKKGDSILLLPTLALLIGGFCALLAPFTPDAGIRIWLVGSAITLIGFFGLRIRAIVRQDRRRRLVSARRIPLRPAVQPAPAVRNIRPYYPRVAAS